MLEKYVKQLFNQFRENRMLYMVSLSGTALSIAMILVLVLVFQINLSGFVPESNRSRMLFAEAVLVANRNGGDNNSGQMSVEVLKSCLYSLKIPEAVTGVCKTWGPISLPGHQLYKEYGITYTDAAYWRVFDHPFLEGEAFTDSDWESAIPRAVITSQMSRDLFGDEPAVGRELILNGRSYRVCGVVGDVPSSALLSYAGIWVPYSCEKSLMRLGRGEGMVGSFTACLLARSSADFDNIREEFRKAVDSYNAGKVDYQVSFPGGLLTQLDKARGGSGWRKVSWKDFLTEYGILLLLFLLIPALNLSGILHAFVQKRREELGLRRVFGATDQVIWIQLVIENLVLTFCGGIVGLLLSLVFLYVCKSFLFEPGICFTAEMLFQPFLFLAAFLVVFLLNLLIVGIPVWWIIREPIIDALRGSK